ncbi:hypothetical protein SKAU_G00296760 [Synaphobranchus kaupii]|uniref:Uncharacterized protein n=1 Tax=Synaphobranchus kaupii TaxID=118154 RepID=A0A9Q1EUW9_SYNKA|nr:hypothetical protein SKAU_G00296760 [Synaphobranchus kaupii]
MHSRLIDCTGFADRCQGRRKVLAGSAWAMANAFPSAADRERERAPGAVPPGFSHPGTQLFSGRVSVLITMFLTATVQRRALRAPFSTYRSCGPQMRELQRLPLTIKQQRN